MNPIHLLNNISFVNPDDNNRPDAEKIVLVLLDKFSANNGGKARHREVPEPFGPFARCEHFLRAEISFCEGIPSYRGRLRLWQLALEYLTELQSESNYSGSFAAITQSKHHYERGGKEYLDWGNHVISTPDPIDHKEIPQQTKHKDVPLSGNGYVAPDNPLYWLWVKVQNQKPVKKPAPPIRKEMRLPNFEFKPFDSLSDTRIIVPSKSRYEKERVKK